MNDWPTTNMRTRKPPLWNQINWDKMERSVSQLQARIVKAQQEKKWNKVKSLNRILTRSFAAKALAVKKVSSNRGSRTCGVDGIIWRSNQQKAQAILELQQEHYRAKPLRRIYIRKPGSKKMRPLGIPTMKDRAMQALYSLALGPIAETTADPNSYGFRPYRNCMDAISQIVAITSSDTRPQWVLEGDIKGCFDNINHEWVLNNIPIEKKILKQWLKCGYLENGKCYDTTSGTPQGGIISPIIANMVLDGIETILRRKYKRLLHRNDGTEHWRNARHSHKINFVRYADDFIVTGDSKEILENEVKPLLNKFLSERGLELSEEKTTITHIDTGFDFLGFNIRCYKRKVLVKPAPSRIKRFKGKLSVVIRTHSNSMTVSLIKKLNSMLRGWANYYRSVSSSQTFNNIRHWLWNKIWNWALFRHRTKGKHWIATKYFIHTGNKGWKFAAKKAGTIQAELFDIISITIRRHLKIRSEANPYSVEDKAYFLELKAKGSRLFGISPAR